VDLKLGFGSGLKSASRSETNFRSDPVAKRDPKLLFQIRNTEIIGFVINFAPRCGYGSVNQDYRSADPDLKEVFMDPQQQSSGSVTFWYGSGAQKLSHPEHCIALLYSTYGREFWCTEYSIHLVCRFLKLLV